eukprot:g5373.t1
MSINVTALTMQIFLDTSIWAPTFRLYSKWTSICGAVAAFAAIIVSKTYWFALFNFVVLAMGVVWKRRELQELLFEQNATKISAVVRFVHDEDNESGSSADVLASKIGTTTKTDASAAISSNEEGCAYVAMASEEDVLATRLALVRAATEYVRDGLGSRFYGASLSSSSSASTQGKDTSSAAADNDDDDDDDDDDGNRHHQYYYTRGDLFAKRLFHRLKRFREVVLVVFLCVSFMERPPWCGGSACKKVPRFGIPELQPVNSAAIELVCVCFFAVEIALKARFVGTRSIYQSGWHVCQILLLAMDFFAILSIFAGLSTFVGLGLFVRPLLFVAKSRSVRSGFTILFKTVPSFADVLLLLVLCVLFGAGVGCVIFQDSDEGSEFFSSLATGINSMVVLLTTANYPDVMMPAYSNNRAASLFFVIYLIVGLFLMLNLVLATICDSYSQMLAEKEKDLMKQRKASLDAAFRLLRRASAVDRRRSRHRPRSREAIKLVGRGLGRGEEGTDENVGHATIDLTIFAALQEQLDRVNTALFVTSVRNNDRSVLRMSREMLRRTYPNLSRSALDREGFERLLKISQALAGQRRRLRLRHHDVDPYELDVVFARIWDVVCGDERGDACRRGTFRVASHSWTLLLLDAISLANVVLVYNLNSWQTDLQKIAASIYVAHILVLVAAGGLKRFVYRKTNVFDLVVSVAHFALAFAADGADYRHHTIAVRIVILVRLLRAFRIVLRLERFKVIFSAFLGLVWEAYELLGMMLAVFFFFAALGEHIFGGMIYETNPSLNGTTFAVDGYFANNFNDFGSSLVLCFELLAVNNWHVLMEGFVAASGTGVSRLYFYAYYVVAVVVVLNLVIAYIVTNFGRKRRELIERRSNDRLLRDLTQENLGSRRQILSAEDEEDEGKKSEEGDATTETEESKFARSFSQPGGGLRRNATSGDIDRSAVRSLPSKGATFPKRMSSTRRLYGELPRGDIATTLSWLEAISASEKNAPGVE